MYQQHLCYRRIRSIIKEFKVLFYVKMNAYDTLPITTFYFNNFRLWMYIIQNMFHELYDQSLNLVQFLIFNL